MRRAVAAALAAALAGCWSLLATPTAGAHAGRVVVTVDAERTAGTTNRKLVGFGFQPAVSAGQFGPLAPATFRLDAGLEHLVACPSTSFAPGPLADLQRRLDTVAQTGAEAIVILDYMPPCLADTGPGDPRDPTRLPPRDPAVWQDVVTRLVTALGPGRAAAGRQPVRYLEVWNEPDWVFFQADEADFVTKVLLPAGRAVDSVARASRLDLRFGLCGCLFADPTWMVPLMTAARDASIPVGFLSWHYYGNYPFLGPDGLEPGFPSAAAPVLSPVARRNPATTPDAYRVQADQVRTWAQGVLGTVPELVVDEWNLSAGGFDKRMDTNEGAAFQAATLAALASSDVDRAALFTSIDPYDRDVDGNPLPPRYGGWGVVDRSLARKPAWYVQWLRQQLGPTRLATDQDVVNGVWTAAGKSADEVDVLVASFLATDAHDHALRVSVSGLAPGARQALLYRVDAAHPGSTEPAETVPVDAAADGTLALDTALPAQSVVLARIVRRTTNAPAPAGAARALPASGTAPGPGPALALVGLGFGLAVTAGNCYRRLHA